MTSARDFARGVNPKYKEWRGFKVGDTVRMLIPTMGADCNDNEREHPAGTLGRIDGIDNFGAEQGWGVHVVIGRWQDDAAIVNTFDDADVARNGMPFEKA